MPVITTTSALASLCAELAREPYITLDTEFIREKTYFPQLCLVQLGGEHTAKVVDPLASGIDLAPLWELLANPAVLKVLHAARQDVEIFLNLMGTLPGPLYDTQVAAMVCGFGEQVGYETLVNTLAGESLDKGSQFTDWSRRPLTERQIIYALGDVTHLRTVYEALSARILADGRESWIAEEMRRTNAPELYTASPDDAWKRLRYRVKTPKYLGLLKALAKWREETAIRRNLPRQWVLKDDALLEIAAHPPHAPEDFARMRAVGRDLKPDWAQALLEIAANAEPLDREEMPSRERPIGPTLGPATDLLRVMLKGRAEEAHVAPRLVASESDIEALLKGEDTPILHGWRFELFGRDARAVAKGELALGLDAKGHIVTCTAS